MPLLILKLLGFGRWIKSAATGAFKWIAASPVHMLIALCAVLALSNAWTWRGWSREEAAHLADNARLQGDIERIKAEQIEATRIATEAKAKQEAKDEQRKKDADNALAQDRALDRRNAADYADSHRVRYKAPSSRSSAADLPESPAPAQIDNGPGAVAELDGIAVSREDFDRCTVNSRRLKNAHDWAVPGE